MHCDGTTKRTSHSFETFYFPVKGAMADSTAPAAKAPAGQSSTATTESGKALDAASSAQNGTSSSQEPAAELAGSADEGEDDDGEDNEEESAASTQLQPGGTLTSKQRKKKKSKAAQKLKKKLGMAGNTEAGAASSSSSATGASNINVTPEMLSKVQSAVVEEHGKEAASKVNMKNLQEVLRMMTLERDATLEGQKNRGVTASVKEIKDHKFWKTQPVMKSNEAVPITPADEGPIQPNAPPEKVSQQPYPLPKDFEWVTVDIDDEGELKEVYELLTANYVEDDDASLRFNYSADFLHWVLKHPGYDKTWHVGVRVVATQKLVAFISGIPHELRVREKSFHSTEINFLCVHKKLRAKRLAPVLIKEVTRRCHLAGIFQAIYTVGAVLPTPMSCARYYHRSINAEKLLSIGFAAVPMGMPKDRWIARYSLPSQTSLPGLREMTQADVPKVGKLLRRYLRRFDMAPRFTDEEIRHVLLSGNGDSGGDKQGKGPRQRVVWTYVIDAQDGSGRITDMASFYSLPSTVLSSKEHNILNAAYLFYYATDAAFDHPNQQQQAAATGGVGASSSSSPASSSALLGAPVGKAMTEEEKALPAWQRSLLTGLSSSELADEEGVIRWEEEKAEVKTRLAGRLNALVSDLMIIAKREGFDVVNSLTTLDNNLFLTDLKFGPGDGFLRWYLYNWRTRPIAGGMGARPGEADLDPAIAAAGPGAEKTWMKGSGLGVAMV